MSNGPVSLPADRPPPVQDRSGRLWDRALWVWLVSGSLLSLFVLYNITTRSVILGSRAGGWTYEYVEFFRARTMIVSLIASALSAGLVFRIRPGTTRRDWPVVLAWIVLGRRASRAHPSADTFLLRAHFLQRRRELVLQRDAKLHGRLGPWRLRPVADVVAGACAKQHAGQVDARLCAEKPLPATGRPGMAHRRCLELRCGAHVPVVRELFVERSIAIYSAALYLLVPAKLYFFPLLNTVTPVIALACALLVVKWLRTGHVGYAAALGVALFGLVFYEPLPLVMGLLFAFFVGRALWLGRISWPRLLTQVGVVVAAWLAAYAMVRLLFGFDLVNAFMQIAEDAIRFNEEAGRPRSIWIWENLREFFFGVGVCPAMVFWAALTDGFRPGLLARASDATDHRAVPRPRGRAARDRPHRGQSRRSDPAVDLPGMLFSNPGGVCVRSPRQPVAQMLVIAVTVMQAGLGTAMIGFIVP